MPRHPKTANQPTQSTFSDPQDMLRNAPLGVFTSTPEGRFISANPTMARIFGYNSPKELIESVTDIAREIYVDPSDRKEFMRLIEAHGEVINHECRMRRKNGSQFWGALNARLGYDQNRKNKYFQGFFTDITNYLVVQEQLAQESFKWKMLVEQSRDGIVILDAEGKVHEANKRFADMLGYTEEEIKELHIWDWDSQWSRNELKQMLREVGSEGDHFETLHRRKDGTLLSVEISTNGLEFNGERLVFCVIRDITDRKRAEDALLKSEERYRTVFENTGTATCILEKDGTISLANTKFAELAGYPLEEIQDKKTWMEFVVKEDLERMRQQHELRRQERERALNEYEFRFMDKDKNIKNIHLFIDVIPGTDKSVASLLDITEQKLANEKAAHSRNLLQYIVEHMRSSVAVHDRDLNYIYVSQQYLKEYKVKEKDVIGRHHYEVFPDLPQKWRDAHQKALAGEVSSADEDSFFREGGTIEWTRWQCRPWYESDGSVGGIVVYTEIITDRKRAEEELRESEERARRQRAAIAALAVDQEVLEGNLFTAMKKVTKKLSASTGVDRASVWKLSDDASELRCLSLFEASSGRHSHGMVLKTASIPNYFNSLRLESRICVHDARTDPRTRELSVGYLVPLKINSLLDAGIQLEGRLAGVVSLEHVGEPRPWHSDEEAFVSTMASLVAQVMTNERRRQAEAQREKLQSQLLQAQKMESIGILAGGIAHDFNNLLHAMGGNLELLDRNKSDDHPDKKRLKTIQRSMDRATQLVKKLLLFTRKADIQTQVLDLNQEIHDASRLLERSIPRMISIDLILEENARPINADPIQVEQVLLNLGTNAADAMPDGGRLIIETANITLDQDFIRTHTGAKPGKYVLMTVSDTGCGMDKKTRDQVFDPFFTTKEVGKGTGLGLASVFGIIKAHEGYIICYSEPGQGTTFKIYWPADPEMILLDLDARDEDTFEGGSETILVVDDEEDISELTVEALQDHGYQTFSAASGEQALEIYSRDRESIDLVVLDLNMPGMGGSRCLEEILKINPGAKALIASGYSANGQAGDILSKGAAGFIGKPFQVHELLARVREVLDKE